MVAISAHLIATLPSLPTLRPCPRRLQPSAFATSEAPHRAPAPGVALRGCRRCSPSVRRFHGFQNAISFGKEHNRQALFASGRGSPSSSDDGSSSPDGPPVLTILAGVTVFLLVLWVVGSVVTWIVGLVFGAAKS
ncbi:uncharacterized protein LOC100276168 isoform 1 [Zea mays]|uniref:Uncharacterized protein n=1 Tax=Zea mays TaxID=4577 RepID=B6T609_MAIZE|nr:uncharacterized protein LOC100276168 isoform 1 [Zea mays]ACG32542.1 hypothetical protein [Zea mays]|eukprot:NP_001143490.1 uncharacterized protein LOC100276168 [Zea mays]